MTLFFNKLFPSEVTTVGGGYTYTTNRVRGILMHVIVRASTSTTIFDFTIEDEDGVRIFERNDADGEINEQVSIPIKGEYDLKIRNSTADEGFHVYLAIREI